MDEWVEVGDYRLLWAWSSQMRFSAFWGESIWRKLVWQMAVICWLLAPNDNPELQLFFSQVQELHEGMKGKKDVILFSHASNEFRLFWFIILCFDYITALLYLPFQKRVVNVLVHSRIRLKISDHGTQILHIY